MKASQMRIGIALCLAAVGGTGAAQQSAPAPLAPIGKGVIVGTVVDAVTGRPIANATVNVSADGNRTRVSVVADDQGQFVLSEAPAGHLLITSRQKGYMPGQYGVRSLDAAFQWFDLADGEKAGGVVIRMWKYAVVSGTVTDASGEPVVGASVMAARVAIVGGRTAITGGPKAWTDRRGIYRLASLPPVDFAIVFLPPPSAAPTNPAYPTLFYPDTTSPASASVLTLAGGEERRVDFHVTRRTLFTVSGTVTGRLPGQSRPLQVSLHPADLTGIPTTVDVMKATVDAQGHFTIPGALPGPYAIEAVEVPMETAPAGTSRFSYSQLANGFTTTGGNFSGRGGPTLPLAPLPSGTTLWAHVPITVEDKNVDNVEVLLAPGAHISGRVVFDGNADKPSEATLVSTPVMAMSTDGRELGLLPASGIGSDGRFETVGLPPGPYEVTFLFSGPDGTDWTLASINLDGREMIGQSLELGAADLTNAVLTFTDHPGQLSGVVRDDTGKPAPEATIYVFPTDRRQWANAAPIIRNELELRPVKSGSYQTTLWPGEYFIVAVTATAQEGWRRTDVLDTLAKTARTVKVTLGQSLTIDLTVPKGQ
jgi:hypothetical protein